MILPPKATMHGSAITTIHGSAITTMHDKRAPRHVLLTTRHQMTCHGQHNTPRPALHDTPNTTRHGQHYTTQPTQLNKLTQFITLDNTENSLAQQMGSSQKTLATYNPSAGL
jgi:hypothetical protein